MSQIRTLDAISSERLDGFRQNLHPPQGAGHNFPAEAWMHC